MRISLVVALAIALPGVLLAACCCGEIQQNTPALELPACVDEPLVLEPGSTAPLDALGPALGPDEDMPDAFYRGEHDVRAVPQVPDAEAWFAAAPAGGGFSDALVICKVTVDPGHAPRSGKELWSDVTVELGNTPTVLHSGSRGEAVHVLSVPRASLAQGDTFRVKATQRNKDCAWSLFVIGIPACWDQSASLGEAVASWDGGPVVASDGGLQAECRAVPDSTVAAESERAADDADAAFRSVCADLGFQPGQTDLGRPGDAELDELAAWIGWSDPKVVARSKRHGRLLSEWDAAAEEWAAGQGSAALQTATVDGVSYEATSFVCGDEAIPTMTTVPPDDGSPDLIPCALELRIRNDRSEPLVIESYRMDLGPVSDVAAVLASGRTAVMEFDAALQGGEGATFASGESTTVRLWTIADGEPRLLALRDWTGADATLLGLP